VGDADKPNPGYRRIFRFLIVICAPALGGAYVVGYIAWLYILLISGIIIYSPVLPIYSIFIAVRIVVMIFLCVPQLLNEDDDWMDDVLTEYIDEPFASVTDVLPTERMGALLDVVVQAVSGDWCSDIAKKCIDNCRGKLGYLHYLWSEWNAVTDTARETLSAMPEFLTSTQTLRASTGSSARMHKEKNKHHEHGTESAEDVESTSNPLNSMQMERLSQVPAPASTLAETNSRAGHTHSGANAAAGVDVGAVDVERGEGGDSVILTVGQAVEACPWKLKLRGVYLNTWHPGKITMVTKKKTTGVPAAAIGSTFTYCVLFDNAEKYMKSKTVKPTDLVQTDIDFDHVRAISNPTGKKAPTAGIVGTSVSPGADSFQPGDEVEACYFTNKAEGLYSAAWHPALVINTGYGGGGLYSLKFAHPKNFKSDTFVENDVDSSHLRPRKGAGYVAPVDKHPMVKGDNTSADRVYHLLCPDGHICNHVKDRQPPLYDRVVCDHCDKNPLEDLDKWFYHCGKCQFNCCKLCAIKRTTSFSGFAVGVAVQFYSRKTDQWENGKIHKKMQSNSIIVEYFDESVVENAATPTAVTTEPLPCSRIRYPGSVGMIDPGVPSLDTCIEDFRARLDEEKVLNKEYFRRIELLDKGTKAADIDKILLSEYNAAERRRVLAPLMQNTDKLYILFELILTVYALALGIIYRDTDASAWHQYTDIMGYFSNSAFVTFLYAVVLREAKRVGLNGEDFGTDVRMRRFQVVALVFLAPMAVTHIIPALVMYAWIVVAVLGVLGLGYAYVNVVADDGYWGEGSDYSAPSGDSDEMFTGIFESCCYFFSYHIGHMCAPLCLDFTKSRMFAPLGALQRRLLDWEDGDDIAKKLGALLLLLPVLVVAACLYVCVIIPLNILSIIMISPYLCFQSITGSDSEDGMVILQDIGLRLVARFMIAFLLQVGFDLATLYYSNGGMYVDSLYAEYELRTQTTCYVEAAIKTEHQAQIFFNWL